MKVVYLSSVWPEPTSSAAGTRVMEILAACKSAGWELCFCATADKNEYSADLAGLGIREQSVALNNSSFDDFIKNENPHIVIFDRFMLEEQFAMRVAEQCPDAMRVLDTSDLHFLRRARQIAFEKNVGIDLFTDDMKRELASIFRSDLTLLISSYEHQLLQSEFTVPEQLIQHVPFMIAADAWSRSEKSFEERQHFMHIGNFLHPPNVDAVKWLKKEIWPLIRQQLPTAECHIYGAYAKDAHTQLEDKAQGFLVKGRCDDAIECTEQYRVALAPLRFGAGIKGKIADAFMAGTPCITTSVGAEGMFEADHFAESATEIAAFAFMLYQNPKAWLASQTKGYEILQERFNAQQHQATLIERIQTIYKQLAEHRRQNPVGAMLQLQQMKSSYYMTKWIEAKSQS